MAKRASRQDTSVAEQSAGAVASAENKIEEFAEDLGRLLGTARAKAEGWIGQRQTVSKHLEEIRDTAADLLRKLGGAGWASSGAVADGGSRRPGRPRRSTANATTIDGAAPKKKRVMSAAARKAISDAQKARWARQKRNKATV